MNKNSTIVWMSWFYRWTDDINSSVDNKAGEDFLPPVRNSESLLARPWPYDWTWTPAGWKVVTPQAVSSVWLCGVDTSEPAGNSDTQTEQASDTTDSLTQEKRSLEGRGRASAIGQSLWSEVRLWALKWRFLPFIRWRRDGQEMRRVTEGMKCNYDINVFHNFYTILHHFIIYIYTVCSLSFDPLRLP